MFIRQVTEDMDQETKEIMHCIFTGCNIKTDKFEEI